MPPRAGLDRWRSLSSATGRALRVRGKYFEGRDEIVEAPGALSSNVDREPGSERSDIVGIRAGVPRELSLGMPTSLRVRSVGREQPCLEHRYRHADLDTILDPVTFENLLEALLLELDLLRDRRICIDHEEDRCVACLQELERLEVRRGESGLASDPHDPHVCARPEDALDHPLEEVLVGVALDEEGELERRYGFVSSHRL
ncbi:MAG TPA: hypothetical protein VNO30_01560 [Kofleriaceae bacterium]|nr:hypothetical protein [Kofleriaceae bacterium]